MLASKVGYNDVMWFNAQKISVGPMAIVTAFEFKKVVDEQWVNNILLPRIKEFERLSFRIEGPKLRFVDHAIESERHITWHACEPHSLKKLVSDICMAAFDEELPRWDIHVITVPPDNSSTILLRVHHSYLDGRSMLALLSGVADPRAEDKRETRPNAKNFSFGNSPIGLSLWNRIRLQMKFILMVLRGAPDNSKTFKPMEKSQSRMIDVSHSFEVAKLKRLAKQHKCNITQLMMACVAEGAKRFAAYRHSENIMKPGTLVKLAVPSDLRTAESATMIGNKTGASLINVSEIGNDFQSLIQRIAEEMNVAKTQYTAHYSDNLVKVLMRLPGKVKQSQILSMSSNASIVFSLNRLNLSGIGNRPITVAGMEVANVYAFIPTFGSIGVGIGLFEYLGKLTLTSWVHEKIDCTDNSLLSFISEVITEKLAKM